MIIRYGNYTLVRAGRNCIAVSEYGVALFEAPTWDDAIQFIEKREEDFRSDMDSLTAAAAWKLGRAN